MNPFELIELGRRIRRGTTTPEDTFAVLRLDDNQMSLVNRVARSVDIPDEPSLMDRLEKKYPEQVARHRAQLSQS
jgi:hypothetical protein